MTTWAEKSGIHWPNGAFDSPASCLAMGVAAYTFLHHQAEWALAMQTNGAKLLHCRYYIENWRDPARSAEQWATECAAHYLAERACPATGRKFTLKSLGVRVTLANEQNLPGEGGNWGEEQLGAIYTQMLNWNLATASQFFALTGVKPDWPAVAVGHSDDQDDGAGVGLLTCKDAVLYSDWLHVHQYWEPGRVKALVDAEGNWLPGLSPDRWTPGSPGEALAIWNGPYRFVKASALYPDKAILISEAGQFDTRRADAPDEMVRWLKSLRHFPRIRAATFFIYRDPTNHHYGNDWGQNPAIEQAVREAVALDVAAPPPLPPVPPVVISPPVIPPPGGTMPQRLIGGVAVNDIRDRFPYKAGMEFSERPLTAITAVVMHHSVTSAPASEEETLALLDRIHAYHQAGDPARNEPPAPAIAYHFAVDPAGRIYYLNGLQLISWHAKAANAYSVGIVWLGTFTKTSPTPAAIEAAKRLFRGLEAELNRWLTLFGHKDVQTGTECPGGHWGATKTLMLTAPGGPGVIDEGKLTKGLDGVWDLNARVRGVATELQELGALGADLAKLCDEITTRVVWIKEATGRQ